MSCDLIGSGPTFAQIVKLSVPVYLNKEKMHFYKAIHRYVIFQKFCPLWLEHCICLWADTILPFLYIILSLTLGASGYSSLLGICVCVTIVYAGLFPT